MGADAEPWLAYGGVYSPYTYGYGLHAPLAYGYGYPSVYSGYHYYGKRSADAEPKADADPYLLYNGLGYAGHYGYGLGYAGYGYGYPSVYSGVHYYGKRSADAEPKADADPYVVYSGLGYSPYTYGYGYTGYPTVYGGYGHFYGKRSAEAEPKADADPYVLYSGLGYAGHYGYGLGYAGYGYAASPYYGGVHYYGKRSADAEPKADAYYGYYGYARPYGGYYGYARPYGYAYYG